MNSILHIKIDESNVNKSAMSFLSDMVLCPICSLEGKDCQLHKDLLLDKVKHLFNFGAIYRQKAADLRPVRVFEDFIISKMDYIRVHCNPRLYPIVDNDIAFWKKRILYLCNEYIVINKPPGIPCNPTVDNYYQNVERLFGRVIHQMECNGDEPREGLLDTNISRLYLPNRLDTDTTGLLIMGRTKLFTAFYGQQLRDRDVNRMTKRYRAILASQNKLTIDAGHVLKNYLDPLIVGTPKSFQRICESDNINSELLYCESKVVSLSQPVTKSITDWLHWISNEKNALDQEERIIIEDMENIQKLHSAFSEWFSPRCRDSNPLCDVTLQEVEIDLVTGRTHQIRGQIQSLQHPHHSLPSSLGIHIAGDNLYVGCTAQSLYPIKTSPHLALQANIPSSLLNIFSILNCLSLFSVVSYGICR